MKRLVLFLQDVNSVSPAAFSLLLSLSVRKLPTHAFLAYSAVAGHRRTHFIGTN